MVSSRTNEQTRRKGRARGGEGETAHQNSLLLVRTLDLGSFLHLDNLDAVLLLLGLLLGDELDLRRSRQTERLGKLLDGERADLEDGLVLLDVDRLKIGDKGLK
jgi:hypothetical protein